ncbi:hypothetical protein [Solirubrobacter phytolaccae]|nr:hypothetical protein [Solirubrobacter phytolaccae]
MTPRSVLSAACLVAAAVVLVPALVAGYAKHALLDADRFADRASATLADADVRAVVAQEVTDRIVLERASELTAARPLIETATADIVGSTAFRQVFRAGVVDVHRALLGRQESTATLTVADAGTIVAEGLRHAPPGVARHVRATGHVPVIDVGSRTGDLARSARDLGQLAVALPLLVLVLAGAGLGLARDRRRAVFRLGAGAAAAGLAVILGAAAARGYVLGKVTGETDRAAATAVWDDFLGDLNAWAWLLAGAGAVTAAAAATLRREPGPAGAGEPVAAGVHGAGSSADPRVAALAARWPWLVRRPLGPGRGAVLVALGVFVLLRPGAALTVVASVGGLVLVYFGVVAILRRVQAPRPDLRASGVRALAAAGVAVLLVGAGVAALLGGGGARADAAEPAGVCNGHRELCDRRLDQVVLPATHNSMSAIQPGWFSAEQDAPIADQLADGVRGLLIDTHYGDRLANGRVRTELDAGLADLTGDDIGPQARAAALRMRERAGFRGPGERGIFLCHTLCELGATPLDEALATLRAFLVTHPGEVVVVINEDYVKPADFVAAVRRADLERLVWTPTGTPPTLGELVETDRRLVLLAEHHAGGAPWYRAAYDGVVQETPYAFKHPQQLATPDSCRPNRGTPGAPLLLLNHWITTDPAPLPANAERVNAHGPLLRRARECTRVRGHVPNLVAVNFYRRGDLFGVVDELNGVRAAAGR